MMMMKNMDVRLDYTKHHKTLLSWCLAMSAPTDDMALANYTTPISGHTLQNYYGPGGLMLRYDG